MADPGGLYALIKSQFDLGQSYATDAYAQAIDYLERLLAIIDDLPEYLDDPDTLFEDVLAPTIDSPTWLELPQKPDLPDVTFPTTSFAFSEIPYTSTLHDAVVDDLIAQLVSSSTGLPADVEEAIWNRAKARTALENQRIREKLESDIASRGWELPGGPLQAAITEAIIEETRANADINEKIMIQQATMTLENRKSTLQFATVMEEQARNYANAVANRTLEAAKATVQMAIELVKGQIDYVLGLIEIYKADTIVYSERVKAASIELSSQIEVFKAQVQENKDKADILLKAAEVNLQVFIQNKSLSMEAAKAGGNVFSQVAASALNAAHASASLGYSGNEQTSYDESKAIPTESTSTQYIHSYNETPGA